LDEEICGLRLSGREQPKPNDNGWRPFLLISRLMKTAAAAERILTGFVHTSKLKTFLNQKKIKIGVFNPKVRHPPPNIFAFS
jgi:hypothetical protein